MKALLALSALLLSASPVLANEFVYLKCDNEMTLTSTEMSTGKIINDGETKSETVYFKIDPNGNRFMSYKPSSDKRDLKWDEATISGGVLSANMVDKNEALKANGELNLEFKPAGKLRSKFSAVAFGMISSEIDISGDCVNVDASIFEKALN
tara:strand:+ start:1865 stop:2320 length:456 start_codon:yes stop_codon:yes gene_type:complete